MGEDNKQNVAQTNAAKLSSKDNGIILARNYLSKLSSKDNSILEDTEQDDKNSKREEELG